MRGLILMGAFDYAYCENEVAWFWQGDKSGLLAILIYIKLMIIAFAQATGLTYPKLLNAFHYRCLMTHKIMLDKRRVREILV